MNMVLIHTKFIFFLICDGKKQLWLFPPAPCHLRSKLQGGRPVLSDDPRLLYSTINRICARPIMV